MAFRSVSGAAVEFENEMTKIITLVGIADGQVQAWTKSIRTLSQQVGRGPRELARALFVVTSAGERGAAALQIVEKAAKASAIGMGDTAQIARAVTAAMQAYSKMGLDAARATDVLVATVREGNLEASALAGSLGRVIGIAAQVGITFADVGAFVATFTRVGVSAEEAVTSLRTIIGSFLKPTDDAAKAMEQLGFSADGLRASIRDRGLAPTLVELAQALQGNEAMIARVIPEFRALAGFMSVAAAQGDTFLDVANSINDSAGTLEDGFTRFGETGQSAMDSIKVAAENLKISLGDKLLPVIKDVVEGWSLLLDPGQLARGRMQTLLTSAAGDADALVSAFDAVEAEILRVNNSLRGLGSTAPERGLAQYLAAIRDALEIGKHNIYQEWDRVTKSVEETTGAVDDLTSGSAPLKRNLIPTVNEIEGGMGRVASVMSDMGGRIIPATIEEWKRLKGVLADVDLNIEGMPRSIDNVTTSIKGQVGEILRLISALADLLALLGIDSSTMIGRAISKGVGGALMGAAAAAAIPSLGLSIPVAAIIGGGAGIFGGLFGKNSGPVADPTTIVINKAAPAVDPLTAANDATWQQVVAETNRALARGGHRVTLAVI
jgi:TP901 family phage tail tape measure protein